ncbi:extracellular solute-binding protein [Paenibacillus campi]|uniref:extracellular solute-binding protein n=1 Tax=Paenibacillus campi TaxID=3106031 RepID=UPI002AFEDEE4|nr:MULTISPECIES: extracellular solute-binding protein [unclassified Paenibacillus]
MKKITHRLSFTLALLLMMVTILSACSSDTDDATSTVAADGRKPGENGFIANRDLTGRIFLEGDGAQLPDDQINNPVAQKIKEKTGMTMNWQSSGAADGLQELTVALSTGDLPDVIEAYLDHGGRPEMPVLLKAAREGMFTDLRPYLANTKVLKNYLDTNFLPRDTRENIMFRPDFDGKVYFIHMNIPAENTTDADRIHYRGGMWIRADIAKALNVDPSSIKTQDDLYNLALKIKAGDFKDNNGKPITVIGPRKWGGQVVSSLFKNYDFGNGTQFDVLDGKVKHVAETDYALKSIDFVQKLLKAGLIDKEAFNMDGVRSEEAYNNGSYAISPYMNIAPDALTMFEKTKYLPMDQMYNYKGEDAIYEKAKSGSQVWAIPATTKNPEQIVQFADYLASKEGKALWNYGIEGEDYTINKKGQYIFTDKVLSILNNSPQDERNTIPYFWGTLLGKTDMNNNKDFGELIRGANSQPDRYKLYFELMNYGNPKYKYWDGYTAASYLSEVPDIEASLKPVLDSYKDVLVQAFFAKDMTEATKILDDYRAQLKAAGVDQYEQFLQQKYDKDPSSVVFYVDAFF